MVFIWYGFYMLLMQKNVMNLNMVIYSEICYELRKTRSFWVSNWYRLVSYTKSWVGLSRQLCRGSRAHAPTLPPSNPNPQNGKLFPDIGINTSAHPSATLFTPLRGMGRQKFCQPGSVLRTQRSSTFSCILKWRCGEKSRI